MKRASYRQAVELIALNDEPECMNADDVSGLASVVIIADLFGIEPARLAADVVRFREKNP